MLVGHLLWLAYPNDPILEQEADGHKEVNIEQTMRQRDQKQKDYRGEKRQKKLQTAFQGSTQAAVTG